MGVIKMAKLPRYTVRAIYFGKEVERVNLTLLKAQAFIKHHDSIITCRFVQLFLEKENDDGSITLIPTDFDGKPIFHADNYDYPHKL